MDAHKDEIARINAMLRQPLRMKLARFRADTLLPHPKDGRAFATGLMHRCGCEKCQCRSR
jgi:hypothetical protein